MKTARKIVIHAAIATSLALTAPLASAVDIGMGVGLINNGSGFAGYGVALPMRFANFTVEPELAFYNGSGDATYPATPSNNVSGDSREYTLDIGVYLRQQVMPSMETYIGGRVGYNNFKQSNTYVSGVSYQSEGSAYYLGPTLGAEYFFNKNLSLGLDVSLFYNSSTFENSTNGVVDYKADSNQTSYQTRTRLRYYF